MSWGKRWEGERRWEAEKEGETGWRRATQGPRSPHLPHSTPPCPPPIVCRTQPPPPSRHHNPSTTAAARWLHRQRKRTTNASTYTQCPPSCLRPRGSTPPHPTPPRSRWWARRSQVGTRRTVYATGSDSLTITLRGRGLTREPPSAQPTSPSSLPSYRGQPTNEPPSLSPLPHPPPPTPPPPPPPPPPRAEGERIWTT